MSDSDGVDIVTARSLDGSVLIRDAGAVDFSVAGGGFIIPPGIDRAAAIENAVLDGRKSLQFIEGDYVLERSLFATLTPAQVSDVHMTGLGDGRTVFSASYAPAGALVDDPTNAGVLVSGAVTADVATTVAAGVPAEDGSSTFTVTSSAGIVAGMWLRFQGRNAPGFPNDAAGMSDGVDVILTEMVQVLSVLGAVVTLVSPLLQWHAPGTPVVSVAPVSNVSVSGITFDFRTASGAPSTIANGITFQMARHVSVENCEFGSFPRTGVEFRLGARDIRAQKIRGLGLLNGLVFGDSCMLFHWEDVSTAPSGFAGEYVHALGIPRHFLFLQERCTSGTIQGLDLKHGSAGICYFGGWYIDTTDVRATDMNTVAMRARNPIYGLAGYVGLGIESGAGPLNIASFAYALRFDDVLLENLYGFGAADFDCAWFLHDILEHQVGSAVIANKGPGYGTVIDGVTYNAVGIVCNDLAGGGTIDSLVFSGVQKAWFSYGNTPVQVSELFIDGSPGTAAGVAEAITINNTAQAGVAGGTPKFGRVVLSNINGAMVRFGPQFLGNPDFNLSFGSLEVLGFAKWTAPRIARNNAAAPYVVGEGCKFDPASAAGELGVITPTNDAIDAVCAVGANLDVGTGIIMVAPLPGVENWVRTTAAAIVAGNTVTGAGAGLRTFVAGPGATKNCGMALRGNGAAAVLLPIGPAVT